MSELVTMQEFQVFETKVFKKFDEVEETQKEVKSTLQVIKNALSGNELDKKDEGLIGTVHSLTKRIEELEGKEKFYKTLLIGISIGSLFAGAGISHLIQEVTKILP